jgi:hypothetical protein
MHNQLPDTKLPSGWKFHITLDSTRLNQLWPELEPLLLNQAGGCLGFKVLDYRKRPLQSGRQIVLYTFTDDNKVLLQAPIDLMGLMIQIEALLRCHQVPTGKQPLSTRKVPGSRYLTYRHDTNLETMTYIDKKEAAKINNDMPYNPFNYDNPFKDLQLSHPSKRFFYPKNSHYTIGQRFYRYTHNKFEHHDELHADKESLPSFSKRKRLG